MSKFTQSAKKKKVKVEKLPCGFLRFFRHESVKTTGFYFLCFAIPALLLFFIYFLLREGGFYPDLHVLKIDMSFQYVYYFSALRDWICGEGSLLYSFSRALGGEFLGMFTYYLSSPLSFIVGLFPQESILEAIMTIYLTKCGLSGLFAAIYLRKSANVSKIGSLIFATLYAMCGYAVVMHINIMWMDGFMLLPLLALSIEKLIVQKKYLLFVFCIAINLMCNYYIGYMCCIFAFFYFFYAYFRLSPEERNPFKERFHFLRALTRIALFSLIAVAIAAVCILPSYYSLTFGKDSFSTPTFDFSIQFPIFDLFVKMMFGTYDTLKYDGAPHIYCGVIVLLLLPLFFLGKAVSRREKICSALLLAVFLFSFSIRSFDLIWHGFQAPNMLEYRYAFMFVFVLLVMAAKAFDRMKEISPAVVISVTLVILALVFCTTIFNYKNIDTWLSLLPTVILLIVEALLLFLRTNPHFKLNLATAVLAVVMFAECYLCGIYYMSKQLGEFGYSHDVTYKNYMARWQGEIDYVKETDPDFYRMEKLNYLKYNDSYALGYRGLAGSTSTLNRETISFLSAVGYTAQSHYSYYIGANPVLDSLLGIRYILDEENTYIPSVYQEYHTNFDIYSFKNPYALSIAYVTDDDIEHLTMSESTPEDVAALATSIAASPFGTPFSAFASLRDAQTETLITDISPFERLNRVVSAMIGEDVQLFYPLDVTIKTENVTVAKNYVHYHKYSQTKDGKEASVTFTYQGAGDDDIFCYFPSGYKNQVSVYRNGSSYYGKYFTNDTHGYLRLGATPENETASLKLKINNDKDCFWIRKNSQTKEIVDCFYALDGDLFTEVFDRLAKGNYNITNFTEDSFDGTIKTTVKDATVLTTIPYDEGWQITVDGKKVESYKVLDALVAFRIEDEGVHDVSFVYAPPIYSYGLYISIAGCIILVFIILGGFLLRRRSRLQCVNSKEISSAQIPSENNQSDK